MRTIKLAFYIARYGNWIDKAVAFFSKGKYSHIEMIFEDGRSYSSSWQDGGTRFKDIRYSNKHKWDIVEYQVDDYEYSRILEFCLTKLGRKYDWTGVLSFMLPFHQDRNRYFCTEVTVKAFQHAGLWLHLRAAKTSPIILWNYVGAILTERNRCKSV